MATIGDKLKEFGGGSFAGLLAALFFLLEELGVPFLLGGFKIASASAAFAAKSGSEGKRSEICALKGEKILSDARAALPTRDFLVL